MQHISVSGPGCVKSRTGQKYVESISLLPSREGGYGTVRLLNRQNREGSSKRKLNFRLFTQPGPKPELVERAMVQCEGLILLDLGGLSPSGTCRRYGILAVTITPV